MLGKREPQIYGSQTLADIENHLKNWLRPKMLSWRAFKPTVKSRLSTVFTKPFSIPILLLLTLGIYHTSVAIRDALLSVSIPFVEVHLSNVHSREPFRHHSYLSDIAKGVICGLGAKGYEYALDFAISHLKA